jgi:hypothetical protein
MKLEGFLSVVPKGVRIAGKILFFAGIITGLVMGFFERHIDNLPYDPLLTLRAMGMGLVLGLFMSALLVVFLLCVGYVYGDAKRRDMRAGLWVLVVIFFPHLLGFLLYFVLRKPIGACPTCGQKLPS